MGSKLGSDGYAVFETVHMSSSDLREELQMNITVFTLHLRFSQAWRRFKGSPDRSCKPPIQYVPFGTLHANADVPLIGICSCRSCTAPPSYLSGLYTEAVAPGHTLSCLLSHFFVLTDNDI